MEQIKRRNLDEGGNRSWTVSRQLERYFDMIDWNKRELRNILSDAEISLILDTFNGIAFADTVSIRYAWHEVADAIEMDRLDEKWKVDGKALVEKMKAMSFGHLIALVDSVEIWWNRVGNGEQLEHSEVLK